MVEIKNPSDVFVRSALWNAYNRKCFYCRELLQFREIDIDHVIPRSLGKEIVIEDYGLISEFELDSYYNLVPTCRTCNNRKRAKLYDKITILFYLNEIRSKVPVIERLESKFRTNDLKGELSATVGMVLSKSPISDVLNILDVNNLTSLAHKVLSDVLTKISPITTLTPKENQQLQIYIDEINKILQDFIPLNQFFTVKGSRFIDNKAGIVIVNEFAGSVTFSLYAVQNTASDIIREISGGQWINLAMKRLFAIKTTDVKSTLLEFPIREARSKILKYFADLISINALCRCMNDFIINEFIIDFIDYHNIPLGMEVKAEYNINEIEFSLFSYLPLWLDETIKRVDRQLIQEVVSAIGYVDIGVLDGLTRGNKKEIEDAIQNRINTQWRVSKETTKIPFVSVKFPILTFIKRLTHLKNKNIMIIKRIYNVPDYTREEFKKTHRIFDQYSDKAVKENLEILYSNLNEIYDDVVLHTIPQLKDILIPFTDSTKLIIELKKRERKMEEDYPFSIFKYYLKSNEKENFEIIFFSEISDSIPDEVRRNKNRQIKFKGKDYEVYRWSSGRLSDIYKPLPLFNKINEELSERVFDLFMKDHKELISKLIQ